MGKNVKGLTMPEVLSFERKLDISDGLVYGTEWDKRHDGVEAVSVIEKIVRGTISNRLSNAAKLTQQLQHANIQTVDVSLLDYKHDTMVVKCSLRILEGVEYPCACSNNTFEKQYTTIAKNYIQNEGFKELSLRYATNIANGRFLWRNRAKATDIEIIVKIGEKIFSFDAFEFSLRNFDNTNSQLVELADLIAQTLCGNNRVLDLEIEAYAKIGHGQEIYNSQDFVDTKGSGNCNKGKFLYSRNGQAAFHSQKLGNAIRTIDTWYPEASDNDDLPISIEIYGSVTTKGIAYRDPSTKLDFYNLFDNYAVGIQLNNKDEEHFVMANLLRGGVFSKGK